MLAQTERRQLGLRIKGGDLFQWSALVEGDYDSDKSSHEVCIAIAGQDQGSVAAGCVRRHLGGEPNLARTTAHLIGISPQRFVERRHRAAKLHHITVAIFPLVENVEVGADVIDRHGLSVRWSDMADCAMHRCHIGLRPPFQQEGLTSLIRTHKI